MSDKRTIGQILTNVGRISDEDVGMALEYQREHGGYFGAALLACGLVSAEELEWGLASQFDLPYVFPDADAVDPAAAAIVSAEWALAHLTLPITKTDTTVTVVVDSPTRTEAIEELSAMSKGPSRLSLQTRRGGPSDFTLHVRLHVELLPEARGVWIFRSARWWSLGREVFPSCSKTRPSAKVGADSRLAGQGSHVEGRVSAFWNGTADAEHAFADAPSDARRLAERRTSGRHRLPEGREPRPA